jgi:hypothetical protein
VEAKVGIGPGDRVHSFFVAFVPVIYNPNYQHRGIGFEINQTVCLGLPDQFRSISLVVFGAGAAVHYGSYLLITLCWIASQNDWNGLHHEYALGKDVQDARKRQEILCSGVELDAKIPLPALSYKIRARSRSERADGQAVEVVHQVP